MTHPSIKYAEDVLSGDILACRWVKLACQRHLNDLEHGHERGLWFDYDAADYALEYFSHLKLWKGKENKGKEFVLAPHFQFITSCIMGWKNSLGWRRFRTAYLEMGRKGAKALSLDTPIPTPHGWTTVNEIEAGYEVYDENGDICYVISTTEIYKNRNCYKVVFSDGAEIVADGGHLWETIARNAFNGKVGSKRRPEPRRVGKYCVFTLHNKQYHVCRWDDPQRKNKAREKIDELLKSFPLRRSNKAIRTTREIKSTIMAHPHNNKTEWNHKIGVAGATYQTEVDLLIPPYTLGAWLGDGHSNASRITFHGKDSAIIREIIREGVKISGWITKGYVHTVSMGAFYKSDVCRRGHDRNLWKTEDGHCLLCNRITAKARRDNKACPPYSEFSLAEKLETLNVRMNKHIPEKYFMGSIEQRFSLLQGLMDTDGTIDKRGHCSFTNTNKQLAEGVLELCRSLGFKPTIKERDANLYGRFISKCYIIKFTAYSDTPVFRLKRKAVKQKPRPKTPNRSSYRQIVSIERVESVPVKCISVDSPSNLFLVSKSFIPTHNSTYAGGLGSLFFTSDGEDAAEVYTAAVKEKQAKIVWENIKNLTKTSMFAPMISYYKQNLSIDSTLSKCEFLVGDPKGLDGLDTHFASLDELHAHPGPEVYDLIVDSIGSRPQPLVLVITTAGFDQDGVCYQRREYLTKILKGVIQDDSFFGVIFTLDTKRDWPELLTAQESREGKKGVVEDDWQDEDMWQKPMPGLCGITESGKRCGVDENGDQIPGYMTKLGDVRDKCRVAKEIPSNQNNFLCKRLNIWTGQYSRWITLDLWDENYSKSVYVMED